MCGFLTVIVVTVTSEHVCCNILNVKLILNLFQTMRCLLVMFVNAVHFLFLLIN